MQVGSISPPILGVFYDHESDKADIRWPLGVCVTLSYAAASLVYLVVWLDRKRMEERLLTGSRVARRGP